MTAIFYFDEEKAKRRPASLEVYKFKGEEYIINQVALHTADLKGFHGFVFKGTTGEYLKLRGTKLPFSENPFM